MPIYEYNCKSCGVFEATQRITENPLTTCPTCGGDVSRLISLTSFVLKGSGWYATDYARNAKSENSGDAGKDSGTNGSADKSESASSASSSSESSKSTTSESSSSSSEKAASS